MQTTKTNHVCADHVVYLDPCDECKEAGKNCDLSTKGICGICGEIIGSY